MDVCGVLERHQYPSGSARRTPENSGATEPDCKECAEREGDTQAPRTARGG
ncbi:MAG: hypothetical protein IKL35_05820 [Muribaculaceae bacterium]|nr:hypothetical protein [Muribaculaceae bacterium]